MSKAQKSLGPGKVAALRLLMQASSDASDVKKSVWEFAVKLPTLLEAGASQSDLRWLLSRRYVEQASEVTRPGAGQRSFRAITALTLEEDACFVLTHAGAVFVQLHKLDIAAVTEVTERIRWDRACHELWVGGKLAKRFLREATAQWTILEAFQRANWQRRVRISLPLNGHGRRDPAHRLREIVSELNKGLDQSLIRFRMDGSGEGVICDLE